MHVIGCPESVEDENGHSHPSYPTELIDLRLARKREGSSEDKETRQMPIHHHQRRQTLRLPLSRRTAVPMFTLILSLSLLLCALWVSHAEEGHSLHSHHHHHNLHDRLHPVDTSDTIEASLSKELEARESTTRRFFAVVIDAGSTGTRLHLFEFSHDIAKKGAHPPFALERETFKEVKPGLSAYAEVPAQAAESVRELLVEAKRVVPEEMWASTPITLKATAGLRLLPETQADDILEKVETEVEFSGFLTDGDSVGLLTGIDEGVFSWFTVNFLLEKLGAAGGQQKKSSPGGQEPRASGMPSTKSSVAALDLGGGSTQVTFLPANFEGAMLNLPREEYSHKLRLFGRSLRLYTHSYLGNGLIAARLGISKLTSREVDINRHSLSTHCLPPGYRLSGNWDYAGRAWEVNASEEASFKRCLASTQEYVLGVTGVKAIPREEGLGLGPQHGSKGESTMNIYAFSYFYERALQAGLVDAGGGPLQVGDYRRAAEHACAKTSEELTGPHIEHWKPWQCLDLSYIYSLLRYGYGLEDERWMHLVKKLKQMEVSWALGAGFHLLNTYHASSLHHGNETHEATGRQAAEEMYTISDSSPQRSFLSIVMLGIDGGLQRCESIQKEEKGMTGILDGRCSDKLWKAWPLVFRQLAERMIQFLAQFKPMS